MEVELKAIETVELKIAVSLDDTKLQHNLNIFLAPLILKLASKHVQVRMKTLKFLGHLLMRFNSSKALTLPIDKLIKQASYPVGFPDIKNSGLELESCINEFTQAKLYSYLFISQGLVRNYSDDEIMAFIVSIISSIENELAILKVTNSKNDQFLSRAFNIFLKLIEKLNLKYYKSLALFPFNSDKFVFNNLQEFTTNVLHLNDNQNALIFIMSYLLKVVLLLPKPQSLNSQNQQFYFCPGLTNDEVKFLTYTAGSLFNYQFLKNLKHKILMFLSLIDFECCSEKEHVYPKYFLLLLFTKVDMEFDINNVAENLLKKISIYGLTDADKNMINDTELLKESIDYYLGNSEKKSVSPNIQEIILKSIFLKSDKLIDDTARFTDETLVSIGKSGFLSNSSNSSFSHKDFNFFKLKSTCLIFIKRIANLKKIGSTTRRRYFNTELSDFIFNQIHNDGWPGLSLSTGNGSSVKNLNLQNIRRLEYETLSDLIAEEPDLLFNTSGDESNFKYLRFFFNSLLGEDRDNVSSVKDSLNKLINGFSRKYHEFMINNKNKEFLEHQLKEFFREFLARDSELLSSQSDTVISGSVSESISSTRYLSLKFINSLFDYDDAEARFLNVYGSFNGNRYEVLEVSEKGLNPYWFKINKSSLEIFSEESQMVLSTTKELMGLESRDKIKFPKFSGLVAQLKAELAYLSKYQNSSLLIETLEISLRYMLQVLIMESLEGNDHDLIPVDSEWNFRVLNSLELDSRVRKLVTQYFDKIQSNPDFAFYLNILSDCYLSLGNLTSNKVYATVNSNSVIPSEPDLQKFNTYYANIKLYGSIFNSIISLSPSNLLKSVFTQEKLMSLMRLVNYDTDEINPRLYNKSYYNRLIYEESIYTLSKTCGIVFSAHNSQKILEKLCEAVNDKSMQSILSGSNNFNNIDFVTSRLNIIANIAGRMALSHEAMDFTNIILSYSRLLKLCYEDKNWKHFNVLLSGINELCKYGFLNNETYKSSLNSMRNLVIAKLKKFDERSVLSFAFLSFVCENDDYIEILYNTHTCKQIEFLFASGEALCIVANGWKAANLYNTIDVQNVTAKELYRLTKVNQLEYLLKMVLKGAGDTKPSLRKACCIWLLCIVQYCGNSAVVVSKSREIQIAFMRFLSDSDDTIQESASTGLSFVYEISGNDLKEDLVKDLMKSFTNSTNAMKLSSGSIQEETELFEPGILKTKDGSISTYKDILNLATDVGDPSLVYKFMSLSKNSSLWSSRRGVAFGLSNIMSKSILEKRLLGNDELTKKLIVKLYRYKFDPNENVSKSMSDIWNILVPNGSKVVELNADLILKELVISINSREWRTRQATTMAMIDLLQIMPTENYENNLEKIWSLSFRALDDIKESVREAGGHLTKFLANSLLRSMESNRDGNKFSIILDKLIPFLIGDTGILSSVDEVRGFSLNIILSLSSKAGSILKPYIPNLIEELLVLMSTLEPQVVNYIALNADKYNLKASDIDAQRLSSIGRSPLMDAIEKMLDIVTDDNLVSELISRIKSAIKRSVGLPSKVMASRVVMTLVVRHMHILNEEYAELLLKSCISQLNDRNETVCMAYANSAGYLCRIANWNVVLRYGKLLKKRYFEFKSGYDRKISAIAVSSISKHANDTFMKLHSFFLPFSYVGSNDLEQDIGVVFQDVWNEHTGSLRSVKMYIDEISQIVSENLKSQQYLIKQVSAKAIANACNTMSTSKLSNEVSINGLSEPTVLNIFKVLLDASKGRIWAGKNSIIAALVIFSENFVDLINGNEDLYKLIEKALLTEVKKRNQEYQKSVIQYFGDFVHSFPNEYLIDEEITVVRTFFSDSYFNESEDSDSDSESESENTKKKIKSDKQYSQSSQINVEREITNILLVKTLTKSLNVHNDISLKLLNFLFNEIIPKLFSLQHFTSTWRTKIAVCENCSTIFQAVENFNEEHSDEIVLNENQIGTLIEVIKINCLHDIEIENVRLQGARAIGNLSKVVSYDIAQKIKGELEYAFENESSNIVKVEIENYL